MDFTKKKNRRVRAESTLFLGKFGFFNTSVNLLLSKMSGRHREGKKTFIKKINSLIPMLREILSSLN